MRSIFRFDDYKQYLKAFYETAKASSVGFSYERFSVSAGIKSPNYFKLVMDGDKRMPPSMIHKFAKAIGLDFDETQFFESLVLHSQAESDQEAKYYARRISELRREKHGSAAQINKRTILEEWYYPAVLTSAHGATTSEAVSRIHHQTFIPKNIIELALRVLLKSGFLNISNERYVMQDTYLYSRDEKKAKAQRKAFLRQHLSLSQRAFEKLFDSEQGHFFAHSFTINTLDYKKFVEQIDSLLEKMVMEADKSSPDKVMQVNVQTFCLAPELTAGLTT